MPEAWAAVGGIADVDAAGIRGYGGNEVGFPRPGNIQPADHAATQAGSASRPYLGTGRASRDDLAGRTLRGGLSELRPNEAGGDQDGVVSLPTSRR